MNEKTAIRILSITAVLLFLACLFQPKQVSGEVTTGAGDYLVASYPSSSGSDGVYIADTRSGMFAVFIYDSSSKAVVPQAVRPISDAFQMRR